MVKINFFCFFSVLGPYLLKAWHNWQALFVQQHQYLEVGHFCLPVLPVANFTWPNWNASKEQATLVCLPTSKTVFDSVLVNIKNAEQEMFEKFSGGETSAIKDRLFHVRQTLKSKNMNFILQ